MYILENKTTHITTSICQSNYGTAPSRTVISIATAKPLSHFFVVKFTHLYSINSKKYLFNIASRVMIVMNNFIERKSKAVGDILKVFLNYALKVIGDVKA
jgi:hypothetical protein